MIVGVNRLTGDYNNMATGIIKRLVRDKGFGFIKPDPESGHEELFFHRSTVRDATYEDLTEGSRVTYEATRSDKGARAEDVRIA